MNAPTIQHWLVAVARAAGWEGAEELRVDAAASPETAWGLVSVAAGMDSDEVADGVARHFRLDRADPDDADPHAHRLVPASVARRLLVLPLAYSDRSLVVATSDPVSLDAEREIGALAGRSVEFRVAPPDAIARALEETYGGEAGEEHEVRPTAPGEEAGPRILVVDDDADARALVRAALEGRGFRVSEARDGAEALERLEDDDGVHLVTLDLQMPNVGGLETLKRIRSRIGTVALPVIVATGSDDPAVEMELFEAGADDFVVKPLDPPRFLLRVQAVLRRRAGGLT